MNVNDLIETTTIRARILNDAKIRDTLAKYNDADWSWTVHWDYGSHTNFEYVSMPKLLGYIHAGTIDPAIISLLEYATSCSENEIYFSQQAENFEAAGCKVQVFVEASQPLPKEDIRLLKKMGIIQTERVNPKKPKAYNNTYLACHAR